MWQNTVIFVFSFLFVSTLCDSSSIKKDSQEESSATPTVSNSGSNKIKQTDEHSIQTDNTNIRRTHDEENGKTDTKSKAISSRRLPTKPIEKIITENPPHLSIEVKNLDLDRRFKRLQRHLNVPPHYSDSLQKFTKNRVLFSNERVKRNRYFEKDPFEINDPYGYRLLHTSRNAKAYYSDAIAHSNQGGRTAEPFSSDSEEVQNIPVKTVAKPVDVAKEDKRIVVPNIEAPARPPVFEGSVRPPSNIERPVKPNAGEVSPHPPRVAPNLYTSPHGSACDSCAKHHHNHDSLMSQSREGHYHRQKLAENRGRSSQYTSRRLNMEPIGSRSYTRTTYYPGGSKLIFNRRFSTLGRNYDDEKSSEGRRARIEEYGSDDRNEYPLEHP